ncbi:ketoacyl-ACP synthase III [Acetivibrio clariflavus]|uniref:3-oxoacyl-(Acyl-carrier-protein) synthase III n=1 Tax=Acetivibrio clariflavus (strain DSM 19732 / NBRC 101661 / EBR45) TaxID=720554 RepID=G8LUT7_ACECE|nr:ketoacyl-ACP synthase III [Acetivibrio clariflavus]AEV68467.1 3-oxoacyl-(acyl-carrier-protein) synthase III [Acetivibrio clariflavus DSM 19732]
MEKEIRFPEIRPLNIDRYARIISTGVGLPKAVVTNQDIIDEFKLLATDRAVQYSLGIKERRWSDFDEKVEDLMMAAVEQCLETANIDIEKVDRVIFTKLFGDYQVPATSIGLLRKFKAKKGIPAFDICSACSGFMHAMDLAIRYVATGDDYVLILGGSVIAKCVRLWKSPDPKTVFLFGDAIAAMLIGYSETKSFLASYLLTNHSLYDNAKVNFGTEFLRSGMEDLNPSIFYMRIADGNIVFNSSAKYAKVIAEKLLRETGLTMEDIDFFVTSDQSEKIWEAQLKELNIPKEKSQSLFHKYGNTVSAMSPINLHDLIVSGRLKRGNLVMMQAHGAGASSGGMIFRY